MEWMYLPLDHIIASAQTRVHSEEERMKMLVEENFNYRTHFKECRECQETADKLEGLQKSPVIPRYGTSAWKKVFGEGP